jgi:dolichol-phosphate mannosyltransferase
MSGFFAVRASSVDPDRLHPLGYKVLLDLVVRTRPPRVIEVPYRFQPRHAGASKSSVREGIRFAGHLATLRLGEPRPGRLSAGLAGVSSLVPYLLVQWLLVGSAGLPYLLSAVVAHQAALVWAFAVTGARLGRRRPAGIGRSLVRGNRELLLHLPLLAFLVGAVHIGYLWASLVTLLAVVVVRVGVLDRAGAASQRRAGDDDAVVAA